MINECHSNSVENVSIQTEFESRICDMKFQTESDFSMLHTSHFNFDLKTHYFKCWVCSREFEKIEKFNHHIARHFQKSNNKSKTLTEKKNKGVEDAKVESLTLTANKIYLKEQPHKCLICGKSYKLLSQLWKHKLLHSGINKFYCGKSFKTRQERKVHQKNHLSNLKFQCDICGKTFKSKNGIKFHILASHNKYQKKHECEKCEMKFLQFSNLKVHFLSHSNKKSFKCELCKAKFKTGGNLKQHKLIVHKHKIKFECLECGKGFKKKSMLNRHLRSHQRT